MPGGVTADMAVARLSGSKHRGRPGSALIASPKGSGMAGIVVAVPQDGIQGNRNEWVKLSICRAGRAFPAWRRIAAL
jgi:hypothetical protein